jgi:Rrf2 family protein
VRLELTKRADYAIRAALALGEAGPDERLSVRRIALDRGIPARFLSQVMADLVAAGLVEGAEGRSGGYRLARPASEVSLLDVIEAAEGDSRRRICILRGGPCQLNGVCAVHEVFATAEERTLRELSAATVAGIVEARRESATTGSRPG